MKHCVISWWKWDQIYHICNVKYTSWLNIQLSLTGHSRALIDKFDISYNSFLALADTWSNHCLYLREHAGHISKQASKSCLPSLKWMPNTHKWETYSVYSTCLTFSSPMLLFWGWRYPSGSWPWPPVVSTGLAFPLVRYPLSMASLRAVTGDPLLLPGVPDVSMDPLSMERGELDVMGVEFRLRAAPVGSDSRALLLTASEFGRLFEREGDSLLMGVRPEISITGDLCLTLSTACLAYNTTMLFIKIEVVPLLY